MNHDWKTLHGFRTFFKTQTERAMKSLKVEILMGHDIGLANCYYKPSEKELVEDYIKSVNLLTINNDKSKLEKQVEELKEKSKDNEYILKEKLQERDNDIAELKTAVEFLKNKINAVVISDQSSEVLKNAAQCHACF